MPGPFEEILPRVTPAPPPPIVFEKIPRAMDSLGLSNPMYTKFRTDINRAILLYNTADTSELKKEALQKIQTAIRSVDLQAPPPILERATQLHNIKTRLFTQIKAAYAAIGVRTMLPPAGNQSPIASVIADMSQEKADQLTQILQHGTSTMSSDENKVMQHKLKRLYNTSEARSPEAIQWNNFINSHSIEFLGGNNSRNYKITNTDPTNPHFGSVKVLKIDNRLDMPRHIEQHLRGALGPVFTPIDADRQVIALDDRGHPISRTLLVTDLCTAGSLDDHANKANLSGGDEIYRGASNMMVQMAQILMEIQQANCCFMDAKLTNWLVDGSNRVRIADTKSFVFTENGLYSNEVTGNEGTSLLLTPGFIPAEWYDRGIDHDRPIDVDKMHASLLGRNLYTYLTGDWPLSMNLNYAIFKSDIGKQYKELISQLVRNPPETRMNLRDAHAKLLVLDQKIKTEQEYQALRNELIALKFGPEDKQMDVFLQGFDEEIRNNGDPAELAQLTDIIKKVITDLKYPENKAVRDIIKQYDDRSRWYTIGMHKKAHAIETAMSNVPIFERIKLLESTDPAVTNVLKAIASHRLSSTNPINDAGKIKTDSAADGFKNFKSKFHAQLDKRTDIEEEKKEIDSGPKI